jgi:hypothetical protein
LADLWSAPPAASEPSLAATQGGTAAVTASSAPASQQVQHNKRDSHQGKEDEEVPDDFHRDSSVLIGEAAASPAALPL